MQKRILLLGTFILFFQVGMAQYTFDQLMSFGLRSDEKGDYPTAIVSLDQAIELKPQEDIAWVTRGVVS